MQQPDLLITGKYLLPSSNHSNVLYGHGVAVSGDTIADIAPTQELKEKYPLTATLETEHGLIMPGLINTHTHAAMSCLRGIADDLPLMTWLEKHIFPIEANLTGEIVYHSTLLSIAEMIKSGTTSFCDMYLFAKHVAKAADTTGIRSWIGEVLYDFPSPCYGELENGFNYIREMFEEYRDNPLISITADPHSVYTCSPELLKKLGDIAAKENCISHIHLSETETEVQTCKERYGHSPVHHLENLGLLTSNTLAAHCVVLTPDEIELLATRGVKISHCIESNMKLASGTAPIVELLDAGACVSIGTDGSASNNDVDMFSEMSSVAKIHKGMRLDPTVMSAEKTLHTATIGGADALGVVDQIGSIEIGKKADLIILDMNQPHLIPCYNIPSHLVYAANGGDVVHSIIGGKVVMKDRKLQTIDEEQVIEKMRSISEELRKIDQT